LKWYDGGEKMESHQKEFLKSKYFSSLKILTPLYLKRLLELFFLFLFFLLPLLRGFDDIWGENHFFKNFFSNGFNTLAVDAYSIMELCTPTWLNHDYGDGRVVDILMVDAYFRVELCTPIFLGEASKEYG
jgi:hypothetical protein